MSFTALLRLKRCHTCDQWHSSRVFTSSYRYRRKLRHQTLKATFFGREHELPVDGHIVVSLFLKGSKKKELVRELADQPASQAITLI